MIPRLLVSVRNAQEAICASRNNVEIVDLKEPENGSLGPVAPETLKKILRDLPPDQCISAALGELQEIEMDDWDMALLARLDFVKVGLAGCAHREQWADELSRIFAELPANVGRVAVAYADFALCNAPETDAVIAAANRLGCAAVLLDTHTKSEGDIFTHLKFDQLLQIVTHIQSRGMIAVVAGSLSKTTLAPAMICKPDFIGIRGAVCKGDRVSSIDEHKLIRFVNHFLKIATAKCIVTPLRTVPSD